MTGVSNDYMRPRQEWYPLSFELDKRVAALMAGNRSLGYQAATQQVLLADRNLMQDLLNQVTAEISRRVRLWQTGAVNGRTLDYRAALTTVLNDDGYLSREYGALTRLSVDSGKSSYPAQAALDDANAAIDAAVKQQISASEGKMDYAEAYRYVLRDQPELATRRATAIRGGV